MPPKKAAKGGKTAEDEELEKERIRLELEANVAARKEECEARLKELVSNLKKGKFENESRLVDQFNTFLENKSNNESQRKTAETWQRWMDQTGRPDMLSAKSMSAFVSRCVESPRIDKDTILNEYNLTEELIEDIKQLSLDYPEKVDQLEESIRFLNEMKQVRIDQMTQGYLMDPSEHIDPQSDDFFHDFSDSSSGISYMLWANTSKNLRRKNVEFESQKVKVELPKGQCTDDAGLRVYFTKQDNFKIRMPVNLDPSPFPQPIEEVIEEEEEDEPFEEDLPAGSATNLSASGEGDAGGSQKGEPVPMESVSVLESVAESEVHKKVKQGLDGKSAVGGVWHIDFLRVPERKKKINNWTIQRYSDPDLQKVDVAKPEPAPLTDADSDMEEEGLPQAEPELAPVGFEITLPIPEENQDKNLSVGIWNRETRSWETENISISEQKDGSIYFTSKQTGAFRFFIDRHNNDDKPLVDTWLIRPNGENIEFHIYTPSNQILFEILPNGNVNLIEQNTPKIMKKEYKDVELESLLEEMEQNALFLFPNDDSFQYLDFIEKDDFVVARTCQNMCACCHLNNFKISEYNTNVDNTRLAMTVNDNTVICTEDRFYVIEDKYLPPEQPQAPPIVEGESNTAFLEELDRFNEKIKKEEEDFEPNFDMSREGCPMEATLDACLGCESRITEQNLTIYKLLLKSKLFNF